MNDADIPIKIAVAFAQNAGPTFITKPLPVASQIGSVNGAASFNDGFVPLNMTPLEAGGVPPFGQDMNGVLFAISAWTRWANAGGPVGYDAAFSTTIGGYPKGAVLSANGTLGLFWLNGVDANGSNPDTGGANWTGFTPLDLMATDTGAGGVNSIVATLPVVPPSWAFMSGRPFLIRKAGTNTGSVNINLNGLGAKVVALTNGTVLSGGELADGGWLTGVYDLTQDVVQLQSQAGAVTPATFAKQQGAIKAWAIFRWTGSSVLVADSYNVSNIVRSGLGAFIVTMSGGLNFIVGFPMVTAYNPGGGSRGVIGMGQSFTGTNPSINVFFNDAGGTGGTDPVQNVGVAIIGEVTP